MKEKKEGCLFSQSFQFPELSVVLKTPDPSTAELCQEYFGDYTDPARTVFLPTWTISDEVCNLRQETTYGADAAQGQITILRREGDNKQAVRLIRDLVMLTDVKCGKAIFKSASVVNNQGRGVVIVGDKGAGKTSLVFNYMLANGTDSRFVSNSHVGLNVEDGGLIAYGYPMAVGVRLGALEAMQNGGCESRELLISYLKSNKPQDEDGRYYLDPKDLRKFFESRVVGNTPVSSIIIVKNTQPGSGTGIRPLSPEGVEGYLKEYYLRHCAWDINNFADVLGVDLEKPVGSIGEIISKCSLYEMAYDITQSKIIELLDDL